MPTPPPLGQAFGYVRAHPRTVVRDVRKGLADKRVMTHASAIYVSSVAFLVGAQLDVDIRKAAAAATGRGEGRERARGGRRGQREVAPDHARAA
jgi:hypothetical protein